MTFMSHEEFMKICQRSLGAPQRGWQKNACIKAQQLGHVLNQPTLSQIFNDPSKSISMRTALIMRELNNATASGFLPVGSSTSNNNITVEGDVVVIKDPDDDKSEEEIMTEIKDQFDIFDECIREVVLGDRHGALVSGPPGCGKSHCVEKYEQQVPEGTVFESITGDTSAIGLYKILHKAQNNGVVIFDDCDGVFADEIKLNLLKGALECKPRGEPRMISWLKESRALVDEDEQKIDRTFDFQGRILFMTNIDFDREIERGTKISEHLKALRSRTGYLSLGLHTKKRRVLHIRQVCRDSDIMTKNGIEDEQTQNTILSFLSENQDRWRDLSLRLVVQLCQYRKSMGDNDRWMRHARALLMHTNR